MRTRTWVRVLAVEEGRGSLAADPAVSVDGVSIAVLQRGRPWTALGCRLLPRRGVVRGLGDDVRVASDDSIMFVRLDSLTFVP